MKCCLDISVIIIEYCRFYFRSKGTNSIEMKLQSCDLCKEAIILSTCMEFRRSIRSLDCLWNMLKVIFKIIYKLNTLNHVHYSGNASRS